MSLRKTRGAESEVLVVDAAARQEQRGPELRDQGDSIVHKCICFLFLNNQKKWLVIHTEKRNTVCFQINIIKGPISCKIQLINGLMMCFKE